MIPSADSALARPSPRSAHLALILGAVAVITRGWRLGSPRVFVFDEIYYANDALDLWLAGTEGGEPVHPPLGKWMLGAGIELLGFTAWGWRLLPLIAGAALVAITCQLGARTTGRRLGGLVAGAAVLLDGITVVTGRLALLDGLLALWTTLALFPLLQLATRPDQVRRSQKAKVWLGVFLGLSLATKWSAAPLVLVASVVALRADLNWSPVGTRLKAGVRSFLTIGVLPVMIYVVAHAGFFLQFQNTNPGYDDCVQDDCQAGVFERLDGWWEAQWKTQDFHRNLAPSHPDVANGWHWVAQTAPVALFEKHCTTDSPVNVDTPSDQLCTGTETHVRVLSVGNPFVWLAGSFAVLLAIVRWARTRNPTDGVLLASLFAFWLPWLLGGRPGFSFYGAPLVPILGLLVARGLTVNRPGHRRIALVLVALWALCAAFLWPLWTGAPISPSHNNLLPY